MTKGKAVLYTGLRVPLCSRKLRFSEFLENCLMKVAMLSALRNGRLDPQQIYLVLISDRGLVDTRATVRPEVLIKWKIAVTPSGMEHATVRLVSQCLNQLCHHVPRYCNRRDENSCQCFTRGRQSSHIYTSTLQSTARIPPIHLFRFIIQ